MPFEAFVERTNLHQLISFPIFFKKKSYFKVLIGGPGMFGSIRVFGSELDSGFMQNVFFLISI